MKRTDKADQPGMTRKRFVNWLLGTGAGGLVVSVAYPVIRFIIPPKIAEAETTSVLVPVETTELLPNSGRIFKFGREPGILVRTPDGEVRAFSAICTHLACTVQYREDLGHIWCACHNGHFDLHGNNVGGPPPSPLPHFDVTEQGTQFIVSRRS